VTGARRGAWRLPLHRTVRRHTRAPTSRPTGPGAARSSPFAVSHTLVVDLARNTIMTALLLAGPMLIVALGVGLIVSILQAVTQIQEQTLSFVPKLLAVSAVFLVALPWILQLMVKFTTELFRSIPQLAG